MRDFYLFSAVSEFSLSTEFRWKFNVKGNPSKKKPWSDLFCKTLGGCADRQLHPIVGERFATFPPMLVCIIYVPNYVLRDIRK